MQQSHVAQISPFTQRDFVARRISFVASCKRTFIRHNFTCTSSNIIYCILSHKSGDFSSFHSIVHPPPTYSLRASASLTDSHDYLLYKFTRVFLFIFCFSLTKANARNVRIYYPYWQYIDLFIFRFVLVIIVWFETIIFSP